MNLSHLYNVTAVNVDCHTNQVKCLNESLPYNFAMYSYKQHVILLRKIFYFNI